MIPTQKTVTTTATLLADQLSSRGEVVIVQQGSVDCYVGGPGVTTSTGLLFPGAVGACLTLVTNSAIYAITAAGSTTLGVVGLSR